MKKLLLIDGNSLIHRAFHALPDFLTKGGQPTNAVYGFAAMLHQAIEKFSPTHLIVCFDTAAPSFRRELFKEYQMHRPKTDGKLENQFGLVRKMLDAAQIQHFEIEGMEADDLIGTIAKSPKDDMITVILTGDKDLFQLIDEHIIVITPQKGLSEIALYDIQKTIDRFHIKPEFIPDLKALMGDQSDNYKGVSGIGPKTAADLILRFGHVEDIYRHLDKIENDRIRNALLTGKKDALISKQLATILIDIPFSFNIEDCSFKGYNDNLKDFFEKMEFRSLLKRFFEKPKSKKIERKKLAEKKDKSQLGLF